MYKKTLILKEIINTEETKIVIKVNGQCEIYLYKNTEYKYINNGYENKYLN